MSDIEIPVRGSMHFSFTLSMPSNNSWNGRWSGEEKLYVICKSFSQREWKQKVAALVGYHSYAFGDGWVALINVAVIDAAKKRHLVKNSAGFCGYNWMVDSLILHGDIRVPRRSA